MHSCSHLKNTICSCSLRCSIEIFMNQEVDKMNQEVMEVLVSCSVWKINNATKMQF